MKIPFTIAEIAFYIAPVLFLLILKSLIRKRLIIRHVAIKPPDVLVPFLLIGIHILSEMTLKFSLLPYFAIFMLSLGIVIVCLMAYKKRRNFI
ncbi:Putative membrane protein (fragment) [Carnobacterium maltaromaticum]